MAKSVLIVDDSASMRQMLSFAAKDAGFDVQTASNGFDALDKLVGAKIDLIITDLNMPEMDGIDLIGRIRTREEFKFVPIIMLTTEAQEAKIQEGRKAGASGWIVKPFSPDKLLAVVKKFVK